MKRPKWVNHLVWFVTDELIDVKHEYPMNGEDDHVHDQIEAAVLDTLCRIYGHEIENDLCGMPEHRYCVHCNRRETTLTQGEETDDE